MRYLMEFIVIFSVCLFISHSFAADKVVVIPLNKAGVKPNQNCPDESPVVGIDAVGNIKCGTKIVFVTSVGYTGNLGGLSGADEKCNTLAHDAGLFGNFKAWLSTVDGDPVSRFPKTNWTYVLPNGIVVANGWVDLVDGNLKNKINCDENKVTRQFPRYVRTGTKSNGEDGNANCDNYTSELLGQNSVRGYEGNKNAGWSNYDAQECWSFMPIYCFEIDNFQRMVLP